MPAVDTPSRTTISSLQSNQSLALPHVTVPDISWVDWAALKAAGFKVCIFDKDNTLCKPFELAVSPALLPSFTACRSAFGGNVVLYSNSAGLQQYDPDGAEAAALEAAFEVQVCWCDSGCTSAAQGSAGRGEAGM
eukprot:GHRQ01026327.1.p2 GENE.GHRQ01026327.1~~GHRQ01026327.1.p2  ORF type:complete len:135 (-),score=48.50 GHRQ01026327.1:1320-1724(-)